MRAVKTTSPRTATPKPKGSLTLPELRRLERRLAKDLTTLIQAFAPDASTGAPLYPRFRWETDVVIIKRLEEYRYCISALTEEGVLDRTGPSSIACTPNGQVVWCTEDPDGKPEYKKLLDAPAGLKGVQIGEADKGAHSYTFWHYAPHEGWKTFNLPAVAVFGSSGIAQFAEKGVTVHQPLMFFSALREAVDTYKRVKAMEIKYDQFGWKDGETKFLCGDRLYGAGVHESVSVSKVADGRVKYLQPVSTGSLGEWRSAATSFFKPGFEAQALTLIAGLASPLLCFIDRSEGGIIPPLILCRFAAPVNLLDSWLHAQSTDSKKDSD